MNSKTIQPAKRTDIHLSEDKLTSVSQGAFFKYAKYAEEFQLRTVNAVL